MKPDRHTTQADRDRELFDRISDHYCRKDLSPASRPARRHRLLQTLCRTALSSNDDILEVGCGAGFTADYLAGRFNSYTGVDYSSALIELAKDRWKNRAMPVTFSQCDATRMRSNNLFDGIIMVGVLHHMEAPIEALRSLRRLLKNGGWIAVNEPSSLNPVIQLLRRIRKRSDSTYSDEQRTYSPDELYAQFAEAGFDQVEIRPQGLFSTPFAEVPVRPECIFSILAKFACATDFILEKHLPGLIKPFSWSLIATARKNR